MRFLPFAVIVLLILFSSLPGAETSIRPSFAVLQHGTPESVGVSTERLNQLDRVLQSAIANEEAPGAVALVARRGKIIYRKAFGSRARVPEVESMTLDTIFDMASLTKVMATATSIMVLVEKGHLSLADGVQEHLPLFEGNGKGAITILQLLTHYSGLRPDLDLDQPWTGYDTAIQLAYQETPVAKPGERFIYSDINFFLLAEIVRRVSGLYLDEFAGKHVFGLLGMTDTTFRPPSSWKPRIAPTERRDGKMLRGEVHDPTAYRMGGVAGHAGLFSTIDDTAIWAQMILNQGVYAGKRILSPYGVLRMSTPQSPPSFYDWRGLGFDIETRFSTVRGDLFPIGTFGHTGFTGTSLWIDPWSETFVLLFTSRLHPDGEGSVVGLRRRVASVTAASILDTQPVRGLYFYRY